MPIVSLAHGISLEILRSNTHENIQTLTLEHRYIQNQYHQHESGKLRDSIRTIVSNFQSVMERLMRHMQHLRHRKRSPVNLSEAKIHAAFLTTTDEFLPVNEEALILYERHYRDILRHMRMS